MGPSRTRYISTRVTEEEYAQMEALAHGRWISEWARGVLLEAVRPRSTDAIVLAEVLGLRTILLNLHFAAYSGKPLTDDTMRQLIDRADHEKLRDAQARFAQVLGSRWDR